MGWTAGVLFPARARDSFSTPHSVQTDSVTHAASYAVDARSSSLGVKKSGLEGDHTPPSSY